MADPMSWYAIEPGWSVSGRDGSVIGTVASVLGDEELDIFHGVIGSFWLGRREVPAEMVEAIRAGRVELRITGNEVSGLPPSR